MIFLDAAHKFIENGISVVPADPTRKYTPPGFPEWRSWQMRVPTEIELAQWQHDYTPEGLAVISGKVSGNLVILDIDKDYPGLAEKVLADLANITNTIVVKTPSGGLHIYLRVTGELCRTEQLFYKSIHVGEIRSEGSLTLAPPTVGYTTLNRGAILAVQEAREWVVNFLRKYGIDAGAPKERALYHNVVERDLGDGERNSTLTSYAGTLRRQGWESSEILSLLHSVNEKRCKPPLPDEQVSRIAQSAESWPKGETKKLDSGLVWADEQKEPEPLEFIIDGLVPRGMTTLLYGDGGQGKSYLALRMAMSVTLGDPFLWRKTKQCNVLYLDWEQNAEVTMRRAYKAARGMGIEKPPRFAYLDGLLPLKDSFRMLREHVLTHGFDFLIVDSFGFALGGEANSGQDCLEFFDSLRSLNELGVAVLVIDHVNKLGGLNGHRSKFAAARSVIKTIAMKPDPLAKLVGHMDVVWHQDKANESMLSDDIRMRLVFADNAFVVNKADEKDAAI